MSEGPTPSEAGPLAPYLEARAGFAIERFGDGGTEQCRRLSDLLDVGLAELFAATAPQDAALVAVGGYGRREQCLHSDVDVMVLHGGGDVSAITRGVLYPLWDAKLAVGHAVRTVREAIAAAEEKVETLCSLLSARLVAGDPELLARLHAGLGGLLGGGRRGLRRVLAAEERARRDAEPYHLLAADLKTGRGGLRTLQALGWDRRRAELVGGSAEVPDDQEAAALDTLLAVRNGLHAVAGKATDRYVPDLRPAVAEWLGSDQVAVGRRLYEAMRTAEAIADERWQGVATPSSSDPVAVTGRWVLRAFRSRGRSVRPAALALPLHLGGELLADSARRLSDDERAAVAAAPAPEWSPADRAALVRILGAGRRGQQAFEQLVRLGWMERALPEWGHVVAAPQVAPLHLHPVDTHLWRTVHELLAVTGSDSDEPLCRAVADDLGALDDATGYRWWIDRLRKSAEQFDLVRIDHFRGFDAFWSVPAGAATAKEGAWVDGPGNAFFEAIEASLGALPIIAEDLGVITDRVDALRKRYGIPGMKVLQFELDRDDFTIAEIERDSVCYTATHDNDTTVGWFTGSPGDTRSADAIAGTRKAALKATGGSPETIHKDLIQMAFSTDAQLAIAPLQDYLGLGSEARMNVPGRPDGNWRWRVLPKLLTPAFCGSVAKMVDEANRAPES